MVSSDSTKLPNNAQSRDGQDNFFPYICSALREKESRTYAQKEYIGTVVPVVLLSRRKENMKSEKQIEQSLVKAVNNMGGIAPKFVSPGFDGMPDRIVLLPHGKMVFVEVKAPGKKPRPLQTSRHEMLRELGFKVYVLDNTDQIGGILDEIQTA